MNLGLLWGKDEGRDTGIVREFEMDMFTLLYLKRIMNKDLLIEDETQLSAMWQPEWEKSLGENGYIYKYG